MAERNKNGVLMHHSYHLSFNANDPFELAIFKALRTMPRGYGKLFFLRMASMLFQDERSTKRLARMMFDFGRDVRPTSVRMMSKMDYKEGDPSTMLTFYPPSVEMEMPSQYFRSNGREETRLKLKAIELMEQDRKSLMRRLIKPSEAIDAVMQDEMHQAMQAAKNGMPCPDQRTFEAGYSKYSPTAAVGKPGLSRQRTPREDTVVDEMREATAGLDEAVGNREDALARAFAKARAENQARLQEAAEREAKRAAMEAKAIADADAAAKAEAEAQARREADARARAISEAARAREAAEREAKRLRDAQAQVAKAEALKAERAEAARAERARAEAEAAVLAAKVAKAEAAAKAAEAAALAASLPGYSRNGRKMGRPRKETHGMNVVSIDVAKKASPVLKKLCWGG